MFEIQSGIKKVNQDASLIDLSKAEVEEINKNIDVQDKTVNDFIYKKRWNQANLLKLAKLIILIELKIESFTPETAIYKLLKDNYKKNYFLNTIDIQLQN